MLYFRGMEKTSSDARMKGGAISWQFDLSRLSEGIKCATQGCKLIDTFQYLFFENIFGTLHMNI